jgi:hypothetical protein
MKRREFITLLGGAAPSWPLAARAQQPAMPVVGYLNLESPESDASRLTGLRRGLIETGYVEGRNFVIEYRFAGNQVAIRPLLFANPLHAKNLIAPVSDSCAAAHRTAIVDHGGRQGPPFQGRSFEVAIAILAPTQPHRPQHKACRSASNDRGSARALLG